MSDIASSSQTQRTIHEEYNDDGLADLTIRTHNGDFHIHKWPLKHSSPIFRDMFEIPQGADHPEQNVVELPEDAKTVDFLLSVIYRRQSLYMNTIEELTLFTEAAVKYDISHAITEAKSLMRQFLSRKCAVLRIYALAIKFEFETIAERAFRRCMLIRLTNPYHYDDPALRNLPLERYQQLLFSKTQRAELACAVMTKHFRFAKWCDRCNRHGCGWWDEYILMVMIRLKDKPSSEVMFEKFTMDSCCQNRCPNEVQNLADSEPYFLVVKAEIDYLPWVYQTAGGFDRLNTRI